MRSKNLGSGSSNEFSAKIQCSFDFCEATRRLEFLLFREFLEKLCYLLWGLCFWPDRIFLESRCILSCIQSCVLLPSERLFLYVFLWRESRSELRVSSLVFLCVSLHWNRKEWKKNINLLEFIGLFSLGESYGSFYPSDSFFSKILFFKQFHFEIE